VSRKVCFLWTQYTYYYTLDKASVPRSAEKVAIGGAGGRVGLPNGWRGERDIGKRVNAVLRVFFIPPDSFLTERGTVGTATITEVVRNRRS
jgi:hypothetical protein